MKLRNILIVTLFSLCVFGAFGQNRSSSTDIESREISETTWILDSFDDLTKSTNVNVYNGAKHDLSWKVEGSQFITKTDEKPYPQKTYVPGFQTSMAREYRREEEAMRFFGVRAAFNIKEVNSLILTPTDNNNTLFLDEDGNPLPGVYFTKPVYAIGAYVLGILRNYEVIANFATGDGEYFSVNLGNLNYRGWKILSARIPISQYVEQDTLLNTNYVVRLINLTIRTNRYERVDDFAVYFDQLFYTQAIANEQDYEGYEFLLRGFNNNSGGGANLQWESGEGDFSSNTSNQQGE